MLKIFCDACGEEINSRPIYPYSIKKFKTHFCNTACQVEYLKKTGHYKRMSLAGKDGRSRVMPLSNREKPRRKKKYYML